MRNPVPKQFNTRMLIGKSIAVIAGKVVYVGRMLEYFESTNSVVLKDYRVVENGRATRSGNIAVIRNWDVIEHGNR